MRKTSDVARLTALIKGKMSARRVIPAITKEVKDILLQEIVRHTKITKIQLVWSWSAVGRVFPDYFVLVCIFICGAQSSFTQKVKKNVFEKYFAFIL